MESDGKVHVAKSSFVCDFCDHRFRTESDLSKHQDAEHRENMFR